MASTDPRADYPLARKLAQFVRLSSQDLDIIEELRSADDRHAADVELVSEGDVPRSVFLLKQGMAFRYRLLADGSCQILTFMIPGDFCDPHCFLLRRRDHSIRTLTPVHLAPISRNRMATFFHHPKIATALQCSILQEQAMLRERIVALGRRDAYSRVAYIFCELLWRYQNIGLATEQTFRLPLTQTELGDTLGLTAVYINRVLKDFRQGFLIAMRGGMVRVLNVSALQRRAGINREYLCLGGLTQEMTQVAPLVRPCGKVSFDEMANASETA